MTRSRGRDGTRCGSPYSSATAGGAGSAARRADSNAIMSARSTGAAIRGAWTICNPCAADATPGNLARNGGARKPLPRPHGGPSRRTLPNESNRPILGAVAAGVDLKKGLPHDSQAKIELRLSEVRSRLNEIAGLEGDAFTDEIRPRRIPSKPNIAISKPGISRRSSPRAKTRPAPRPASTMTPRTASAPSFAAR